MLDTAQSFILVCILIEHPLLRVPDVPVHHDLWKCPSRARLPLLKWNFTTTCLRHWLVAGTSFRVELDLWDNCLYNAFSPRSLMCTSHDEVGLATWLVILPSCFDILLLVKLSFVFLVLCFPLLDLLFFALLICDHLLLQLLAVQIFHKFLLPLLLWVRIQQPYLKVVCERYYIDPKPTRLCVQVWLKVQVRVVEILVALRFFWQWNRMWLLVCLLAYILEIKWLKYLKVFSEKVTSTTLATKKS